MKILHEKFPGYTECAFNDNQRAAVANLLQIILCGEDLRPDTEFCIQIKETEGKSTVSYETDFPGDKSYALYRIDIFESRKDNVPSESMMRGEMKHAINGFGNSFAGGLIEAYKPVTFNDLLDPDFNIPDAVARLHAQGIIQKSEKSESSTFSDKHFRNVFKKYLSAPLPQRNWDNSDQAESIRKKLVEKLELGIPFSDVMMKGIADELDIDLSVVKEDVTKMWPMEMQQEYQKQSDQVQKLIEDTTVSASEVDALVAVTKLPPSQVEPLLRLLALDALTAAVAEKTDTMHFEHNIHASIGSFTKDCIDRTLNSFTIGDEPPQRLGKSNAPNMFQRAGNSFLSHLTDNTVDATLQIQELNASDLLQALSSLGLPTSENSNFSEDAFLSLLQPHLASYAPTRPSTPTDTEQTIYDAVNQKIEKGQFTDSMIDDIASDLDISRGEVKAAIDRMWEPLKQERYNQLMGAVVYSRIPQDLIAKLASATGRPEKEVEPAIRLKFIQMMGLMNQSVMAKFTEELVPIVFLDFEHPMDPSFTNNAPPSGIDNTFRFTPDFRGLTYEPLFKFQSPSSQLELEGREEHFIKGAIPNATGRSTFTVADFSSKNPATNRQLSDLTLSWNTTTAYANHLSSLIDPKILKGDFNGKLEALHWTPWLDIDLSPDKADFLYEQHGIKGTKDLTDRIDSALLAFQQGLVG